ncbi:rhodanese-like domain-containing protein [Candidatus Riesia pediculischaeffi]|uniref:Rhodanese domain protein n=1 Tax=Candidatus Riesia pediculischaeffi PTSU TaxID=1401651 RepID=A0A0C1VK17_9ENTR|nr:rhodanese-like domain-containing protein [Candidatus Riesia pediculischaeffi]KIE64205.1 rhodanese domain protein [Candidatus Riesia pediculischaeffi PTSU]
MRIKNVGNYQLIQWINQNKTIIIDFRDYDDFYKEHIIHSIHFSKIIPQEENQEKIKNLRNKTITIITKNGTETLKPAKIMRKLVREDIYVLIHGINGWKKDLLPLIKKQL